MMQRSDSNPASVSLKSAETDPKLTKEQVGELSKAMVLQKQVSLISISVVTVFKLR